MSALGFIPDVLILSTTFVLIIIFRKKIAEFFCHMNLPNFLIYLISSIPFMLFEENINCLPTGCQLIPMTIPFLLVFAAILGFIVKKTKPKKIWATVILFSLFGILFEFVLGAAHAQLQTLGLFALFFVFWVGISYAYIVIVPLTILIEHKK